MTKAITVKTLGVTIIGEGSIVKRSKNVYRLFLTEKLATGSTKRHTKTIKGNKRKAQEELVQWRRELESGLKVEAEKIT